MVSPDSTFEGPEDLPPALIDNDSTSDSGIDEANVLSRSGSTLNIASYEILDNQPSSSTKDEPEKRVYRKRKHSALIADEVKEKVLKNRSSDGPPTPPNVGPPVAVSPFNVNDAFLMEYNLAGEEYLTADIENFLE